MILYSDGLVERRSDESLDVGLERLASAARSGPASAAELCQHLMAWTLPEDAELHDDVTAMLARVLPTQP